MRLHLSHTRNRQAAGTATATPKRTQAGQQSNLRWDCAHQAIVVQMQLICRMEMQMEYETMLVIH